MQKSIPDAKAINFSRDDPVADSGIVSEKNGEKRITTAATERIRDNERTQEKAPVVPPQNLSLSQPFAIFDSDVEIRAYSQLSDRDVTFLIHLFAYLEARPPTVRRRKVRELCKRLHIRNGSALYRLLKRIFSRESSMEDKLASFISAVSFALNLL